MNRKYSAEMRERALRMLAETRPSHPTMMSAVRHGRPIHGEVLLYPPAHSATRRGFFCSTPDDRA